MKPDGEQVHEAIRSARLALSGQPAAPTPQRRIGAIDQTEVAFQVFKNLLETQGVRQALSALLRRTD